METNNKQNVEIAEVKKDISWIKEEIGGIKTQVFNHLPTALKEINTKIDEKCVKRTDFLVGIIGVIAIQILLKFFL